MESQEKLGWDPSSLLLDAQEKSGVFWDCVWKLAQPRLQAGTFFDSKPEGRAMAIAAYEEARLMTFGLSDEPEVSQQAKWEENESYFHFLAIQRESNSETEFILQCHEDENSSRA